MAERSVFEKLAETLPEKERKDLLARIYRSLDFGTEEDETVYHQEMSNDEREVMIRQDLERLSLLGRFVLWLRSVLSGRNRKDLLIATKIRALKAQINQRSPGLTGFETRDLSPKLAEAFFDLYKLTLPVRAVYSSLLLKSREIEGAFIPLLERMNPETRVRLEDVVPLSTLEEVYDEKGAEQAVKRTALESLDQYVERLDDSIFDQVEQSIIPVFYLKDVVFFPYAAFFDLFHVQLRTVSPEQRPVFQTASAMLTIEYLEKMFFAIYAALKVQRPYLVKSDVARYLTTISRHGDATGHGGGGGEDAPAEAAEGVAGSEEIQSAGADSGPQRTQAVHSGASSEDENALVRDLSMLFEGIRNFERRVPLAELIRYFLKDPYYKLFVYVPLLQLKEYYLGILKVRFVAELDELWSTIKTRVIDTKIERLFKGEKLVEFRNYREYKGNDYEKMGLPFFSHTRSLNIIFNFVRWYYRGYVQEIVKILATVILAQNRISRNKLLLHATAIEDIEEKVKLFDDALSPDSEEGKLFHRLRSTLAGDTSHQRMYRTIVLQKDVQVNGLIERARDSLSGLEKVFEEVVTTPSEAVRERLGSRFYLNGKLQPLSVLLKDRAEYMRSFLSVLLQVLRLEGG